MYKTMTTDMVHLQEVIHDTHPDVGCKCVNGFKGKHSGTYVLHLNSPSKDGKG